MASHPYQSQLSMIAWLFIILYSVCLLVLGLYSIDHQNSNSTIDTTDTNTTSTTDTNVERIVAISTTTTTSMPIASSTAVPNEAVASTTGRVDQEQLP